MGYRTLGAVLFILCIGAPDAQAETWRQECRAVETLARVDYDSRLSVNWLEDTNKHTCFFSVVAPPLEGENSAIKDATGFIEKLRRGSIDFQQAIGQGAGGALFAALTSPLQDKELQSSELNALYATLKESSKQLDNCLNSIAIGPTPYTKMNDVISCGMDNSAFLITASASGLVLGLRIALG